MKKVIIIGAGTGGIDVAARLANSGEKLSIMIIDPASKHYYQPFWTLVGAGISRKEVTEREMKDLIPSGVEWVQDKVTKIEAFQNQITTEKSGAYSYDYLVVTPGLELHFEKIKGLEDPTLPYDGVCSIYSYQTVDRVWDNFHNFKGGQALFTFPNTPIKCGGAPQKIMYLFDSYLRKKNRRQNAQIFFTSAGQRIFGVPEFAKALNQVVVRKGIHTRFNHNLIEVDTKNKVATYCVSDANGVNQQVSYEYSMLHVSPPMAAPKFIQESAIAHQEGPSKGWANVNINTLQSPQFSNVFALGDVAALPTAKTGAAIRKQAPIVVKNLLDVIRGKSIESNKKYDGYSSCPLITEYGKVILAEFGYNDILLPSFPLIDMTKERYSMWLLKKDVLPVLYWKFMMKGRA
ncbi:MAG: FAD/NAD(P)-binding oxidoreductase [Bdellovibrio sp.]